MRRLPLFDFVLRALGILLVIAALLKGHELLTVPVANTDMWSWRPFLIFQVEFELALGIWLLSGLFKHLGWLAGLACFGLFGGVTLYRALTGAASCGCFGTVHVNPWITFFAVDLPAVIALSLFRPPAALAPMRSLPRGLSAVVSGGRDSIRNALAEFARPVPSPRQLIATAALGLTILGITTPILALNQPAVVTSTYEVLEPEAWIGKKLPILEYIDIGNQLKQGNWLVLLYHHDCPDCQRAIPQYEQMAHDLADSEGFLRIALIEVPPYGHSPASAGSPCALGQLANIKDWFVTTPAATLLVDATVKAAWEAQIPDFESIMVQFAEISEKTAKNLVPRVNINRIRRALGKEGRNLQGVVARADTLVCRQCWPDLQHFSRVTTRGIGFSLTMEDARV